MALTKIGTDGFKDDAVTTDKLANAINTERTANTAKTSTTINNNADNRVITGSGTANTLEGESTLTFDGSLLKLQVDNGEFRIESANGVDQLSVDSDNGNSFIHGKLGIGTGASTHQCASGGLDLRSVGAINKGALFIGADSGQNSMSRSSNTEKQFRMMMPSYADPNNGITVLYGEAGNSEQLINYGGNTGWAYAINGHRFYAASNTTTANGSLKVTIDSDGLKFNGDTGAANALDDYEEGTFSPSFKASSASGNSSTTVQESKYIKIGGMVHFSFYIDMNAHHSDGTGGHVEITGLPFQNTGNHVAISVGYFNSFIENQNFLTGTVQPGTTNLLLRHTTGSTTSTANMDYSNAIGTSTEMIISGCYATAS